jgi:hypothetical protein
VYKVSGKRLVLPLLAVQTYLLFYNISEISLNKKDGRLFYVSFAAEEKAL